MPSQSCLAVRSSTLVPPPATNTWRRTLVAVWLGISRSTTETLSCSLADSKEKYNINKNDRKFWQKRYWQIYLPKWSAFNVSYWRSPKPLLITWISSSRAKKNSKKEIKVTARYILSQTEETCYLLNQLRDKAPFSLLRNRYFARHANNAPSLRDEQNRLLFLTWTMHVFIQMSP